MARLRGASEPSDGTFRCYEGSAAAPGLLGASTYLMEAEYPL